MHYFYERLLPLDNTDRSFSDLKDAVHNYLLENRDRYRQNTTEWGGVYTSLDGSKKMIVLPPEYNDILTVTEKLYIVTNVKKSDYFNKHI